MLQLRALRKRLRISCNGLIDDAKPGELGSYSGSFEVNTDDERCSCMDLDDVGVTECFYTGLKGELPVASMRVNVHREVVTVVKRTKGGVGGLEAEARLVGGDGPDQFCSDRRAMNIGSAKECRDTNARIRETLRRVLARAKAKRR